MSFGFWTHAIPGCSTFICVEGNVPKCSAATPPSVRHHIGNPNQMPDLYMQLSCDSHIIYA